MFGSAFLVIVDYNTHEHVHNKKAHHQQVDNKEESHEAIVVFDGLHINTNCVNSIVHNGHPAVASGHNEQCKQGAKYVVIVVCQVHPFVVCRVDETIVLVQYLI